MIATEGEARVLANMRSKAEKASQMFEVLVQQMSNAMSVERINQYTSQLKVPTWL